MPSPKHGNLTQVDSFGICYHSLFCHPKKDTGRQVELLYAMKFHCCVVNSCLVRPIIMYRLNYQPWHGSDNKTGSMSVLPDWKDNSLSVWSLERILSIYEPSVHVMHAPRSHCTHSPKPFDFRFVVTHGGPKKTRIFLCWAACPRMF